MILKVLEGFRKSPEDFRKLPEIAEDYLKTSKDFRKLVKVADDEPKILERLQNDCECFLKSAKYGL